MGITNVVQAGEPLERRSSEKTGFPEAPGSRLRSMFRFHLFGTDSFKEVTFQGHYAAPVNHLADSGCEEWEINDDLKVMSSLGWFQPGGYQRQIGGSRKFVPVKKLNLIGLQMVIQISDLLVFVINTRYQLGAAF